MEKEDRIFAEPGEATSDFNFGEKTAAVFDDMLDRSIPQYRELQRMIGEMAAEFAVDGSNIYDLGCSTGITLETLRSAIDAAGKKVHAVGVDNSQAMLERGRMRFADLPAERRPSLVNADLNFSCPIENASVVVLNLTLQFVRPLYRDRLIRQICEGMIENGCLILVEKVLCNDSVLNRIFIKLYYDMKRRNGYSETEISKKREALENVLIPYRLDENLELLRRNGFDEVDSFFRHYNFAGIVGLKRG
jgi:tRNA (cmo5U34)-methyltransferase